MRTLEISVMAEALQNFDQDQIAYDEQFLPEQLIKFVGLRRHRAVEVIDPDARIDQNQSSVLIASRSPSQWSLPRNLRISACLLTRTSMRKPRSTASFFVLRAAGAQGIPHQFVIDHNIGAHGCVCSMTSIHIPADQCRFRCKWKLAFGSRADASPA